MKDEKKIPYMFIPVAQRRVSTRSNAWLAMLLGVLWLSSCTNPDQSVHRPLDSHQSPASQPASSLAKEFAPWPNDKPLPELRIVERTERPLLRADQPWESLCVNYASVLCVNGQWHMWYESYDTSYHTDNDSYLCYARSKDGQTWEKPRLGLFEYQGSRENNIITQHVHGSQVFIDSAADTSERLKIVYAKQVGPEWWIHGGTSPDGIHWNWIEQPLLSRNSDTQNACIVEPHSYRLYMRQWTGGLYQGRRAVGYCESKTFGGFGEPVTILQPDDRDPTDLHFYNSAASELCPGLYIMWPSAFTTANQQIQPHLALSRDGRNFERVGRQPVIKLGQGFDSAAIYVSPGAVPADRPGEFWFYYLGSAIEHDANPPGQTRQAGGIGRFRVVVQAR